MPVEAHRPRDSESGNFADGNVDSDNVGVQSTQVPPLRQNPIVPFLNLANVGFDRVIVELQPMTMEFNAWNTQGQRQVQGMRHT